MFTVESPCQAAYTPETLEVKIAFSSESSEEKCRKLTAIRQAISTQLTTRLSLLTTFSHGTFMGLRVTPFTSWQRHVSLLHLEAEVRWEYRRLRQGSCSLAVSLVGHFKGFLRTLEV